LRQTSRLARDRAEVRERNPQTERIDMTAAATNRRRKRTGAGPSVAGDTRSRIIEAAVACILERGLYRATSNEIARRAGLTWGAIQRQFGSREALMFAVFEDEWSRLLETQRDACIEGDTVEDRIRSLYDVLTSYYGRPAAFVSTQIAVDLRKDPQTSRATLETMARMADESRKLAPPLMRQVFGADDFDPTVAHFVYFSIRDFNIGRHVEAVTAPDAMVRRRLRNLKREEDLLIGMLATTVESSGPRARSPRGRKAP
jgi:AcrR family transcriptional regulator